MRQAAQTSPIPATPREQQAKPIQSNRPRRVYALDLTHSLRPPDPALLDRIAELGFDTVLLALPRYLGTADITTLPPIAEAAAAAGMRVQIDLALDVAGEAASVVSGHPDWYRKIHRSPADPREAPVPAGRHIATLSTAATIEAFVEYWTAELRRLGDCGIGGYRCKPNGQVPPAVWQLLTRALPEMDFAFWAPGVPEAAILAVPPDSFNVAYNSLAWWDFGAGWLRDEMARLQRIAPVANTVGLREVPASGATARQAARRLLEVAAGNGHGILMPMGFEFGLATDLTYPGFGADDWQRLREHTQLDFSAAIREANQRLESRSANAAAPTILSAEDAPVAVLLEQPAQLTLANRFLGRCAAFDPAGVLPLLDGTLSGFMGPGGNALIDQEILLAPGEVRVFTGAPARPILTAKPGQAKRKGASSVAATAASRVAIEAIEPAVDAGRFAVKRVVGERVTVAADILADGHGKIAAALQWRAGDAGSWHEMPMQLETNDRWSGRFLLERVGPWWFRVIAWPDRFATWRDEFTKKHAAGLDVTLELEEGKRLVTAMAAEASGRLDDVVAALRRRGADRMAVLLDPATGAEIARSDTRPGSTVSGEMPVVADRRAAEFASWYELFPRNQSGDPARHGTFRDVIGRLPGIRAMGFDVLYFPPIHPIGLSNRKGRDNAVQAAAGDPGSPYAIGAAEGGHDAIHPALGSLDDFHALRDAAADHGLELALDFAIQCSPDHPWLREHPGWFDWRPDGGLRYAENPPKKYEDIVNVDFHRADAIPGLWLALRDVVAYWLDQGVRIFRVDNPHTKPFAFWEWLIADIRARNPQVLFLSEAFTRPKVMYRLAKLGFSQSYTYFTWRNEKAEIETYLQELTATGPSAGAPQAGNVADFFRPNLFVNTPDINPVFLQQAGRAGFLIRAALATTLSGLWGMLQGFEFCEAAAVPGREEYANSDKYEIRARPERAAGDIVDEITQLNAIRRANPALQSHRGLAFHPAFNDRVIWYRKANVDRSNVVLIAVSLDPFAPQTADVEVPLWEWGLADSGALIVDDLVRGGSAVWTGKFRSITLDPATLPFGIWRARPQEIA